MYNKEVAVKRLNDYYILELTVFKYAGCVCSVTQLCLTLASLCTRSLPVSSVHGIFQASVLEQVAISFCRGIFSTQGSNLHLLHLLHR